MQTRDIKIDEEEVKRAEAEMKKTEWHWKYRFSHIPPRFESKSRADFTPPPKLPVDWWQGGYFFTGPAGTGKTMLASILAKERLQEGKRVRFISVPEFLVKITKTFRSHHGSSADEIIDSYVYTPWLVLDDLGAERASEWAIEHLYLLLDKREKEMMDNIIITSNLTLDEIATRVSDRIPSRIAGLTQTIKFTGIDHRLKGVGNEAQ